MDIFLYILMFIGIGFLMLIGFFLAAILIGLVAHYRHRRELDNE